MKTIVNEYLSEEERNEFKSKRIPNPAFGLDYLSPIIWTIDKDNHTFMFECYQDREPPHDLTFYMEWHETSNSFKLHQKWLDSNTRHWSLVKSEINPSCNESKQAVIAAFKELLLVYGFKGIPNDKSNEINIVIDF